MVLGLRLQKRSFMKMTEVFAITGGYMQLIATIFKIISLLNNKTKMKELSTNGKQTASMYRFDEIIFEYYNSLIKLKSNKIENYKNINIELKPKEEIILKLENQLSLQLGEKYGFR